jgi:hypothetical protein
VNVAIVNGRYFPVGDDHTPTTERHDVEIGQVGGGGDGRRLDAKGPAIPSECTLNLDRCIAIPDVGALAVVENLQSTNVHRALPDTYHRFVLTAGLETKQCPWPSLEAQTEEDTAMSQLVTIVIIIL